MRVSDPIQRNFALFVPANPHVYDGLVALTRESVSRGRKYGIQTFWETLRWNGGLRAAEGSPVALVDAFRSRYARLIMELEPDLAGYFEVRPLAVEKA